MSEFGLLVDELLEETWRHDPAGATQAGIHRYDHLLPDVSPDALEDWGQKLRGLRRRFEAVDAAGLTRDEQIDRRWGLAVIERDLLEHDLRNWERAPRYYLEDLGAGLHALLIGQHAPAEERMRAVLARLEAIPALLEAGRRNLVPEAIPPVWIESGLATARGTARFVVEAVPQAAAEVAGLEAEVARASQAAARAIADFAGYVSEVGGRARGEYAIGAERFDALLKHFHMLDMDSRDLYDFGREWIERYETEMVEVARRIDPGRHWLEVLESVKDNHPTAEHLCQAYDEETQLARRYCLEHDLVTFPEGESCALEWTPGFMRSSTPIAQPWVSPPFEPGLASKWYITPVDPEAPPERQLQHLRDSSWAWIRGIAMHEIYPGHHLQLVTAKQLATPLRLQNWSPIYGEGWGLYTEELFYETGLLADPPYRLMQLRNGLWRAVRIVVDTGLHARGMSVADCVAWLVERARLEPRWAESETRYYTTRPTYPSSYRVGLSLIMELREAYKAKKGSGFRLKEFHDTFMRYGTLPLKIVREEMVGESSPRGAVS